MGGRQRAYSRAQEPSDSRPKECDHMDLLAASERFGAPGYPGAVGDLSTDRRPCSQNWKRQTALFWLACDFADLLSFLELSNLR